MTASEVLALLEANQDERGIQYWKKLEGAASKLRSFGLGLTRLRKLAKQIGRDHELAMELWKTDVYDAKVIALLIDDPKLITREQAEAQVEQLEGGYLEHVFSSCDATLAKTPFVVELADDWMASEDAVRRCCGYGLLYEISKWKKKSAPDDAYFLERIAHIAENFDREEKAVKGSMGGALMGIGKRNVKLNRAAVKLARVISPIDLSSEGRSCEPFDVVKHLTSDYLKEKLGV